jgi:hypothetical protein
MKWSGRLTLEVLLSNKNLEGGSTIVLVVLS